MWIVFIAGDIRYDYRISYVEDKIIDESLHYYPKGRRSLVFERKDTDKYRYNKEKMLQNDARATTIPVANYLSVLAMKNSDIVKDAFLWLTDKIEAISPENDEDIWTYTVEMIHNNERKREMILELLRSADLSITNIITEVNNYQIDNLPEIIPIRIKEMIMINEDKIKGLKSAKINMEHSTPNNTFLLNFSDESEGTKRFFSIMGPILDSIINGKLLVIDELALKLHSALLENILLFFHNNSRNSQIIFTTHNTTVMDIDIMRRDQIWFTELKSDGSTDLYSLVEFNPRKDKNIQKGYLQGRYGALPILSDANLELHTGN